MDNRTVDYEWFADLQKSQSFTTADWRNPSKSSDFGCDGYTASITAWHELLQITAPDPTCGIIFLRGIFPNIPDAILSRSQRRDETGKKGAFGIQLHPESYFELGEKRIQGFVNLRWPYVQYELKRKPGYGRANEPSGILEEISFVKDGTVFQLVRVKWGHSNRRNSSRKMNIKFKIGGRIQFGCPCSNGGPPDPDTFETSSLNDGSRIACASVKYEKRLEMQVFVNGRPRKLESEYPMPQKFESTSGVANISATQDVEIYTGKAAFILSTYSLRDSALLHPMLDISCVAELDDYLGISTESRAMYDRLWTACLTPNYGLNEAEELCVVGKAVEQILTVSAVVLAPSKTASAVSGGSAPEEETGIALIRNVITTQYVDLQSSFWQLRLLVKIYRFLQTRRFQRDLLDPIRSLDEIRTAYLAILQRYIRGILIWMLNTTYESGKLLLPLNPSESVDRSSPRLERCEGQRAMKVVDLSYNQIYFVTLSVWYVVTYCPEAATSEFRNKHIKTKLGELSKLGDTQDSWGDRDSTPKNDVLQWFHLSCLFLILQQTYSQDETGQSIDGFQISGVNRQDYYKAQQKCQKFITRLQRNQTEPYSMEHEELDRLVLLGEELGLEALPASSGSASVATARARQTCTRIYQRKRTTRFNPGPTVYQTGKTSEVASNGPWELACLNHHSQLRIAVGWEYLNQYSIHSGRDRCFEFLLSDYTFMTSWDRADSDMIGKWWDFEPASIISATIIDLKTEGKLDSAKADLIEDLTRSKTAESFTSPIEAPDDQDTASRWEPGPAENFQDLILQLRRHQSQ